MTTYSNPRTSFQTDNWPYGRKRVTAIFTLEQTKRGERVSRVTQNPKGGWNKPKKLTYAYKQRIVDGNDGKTYIAVMSQYGTISIMQSDMKLQKESIPTNSDSYAAMLNLFV